MLEGVVARILNQLLGKYVLDLDTENLNVGIFSGHVQLTDLKLKPEALYELNLPIEVQAGTIGKIWLQIPWTSLWNQPIIVNIADIVVIAKPVVSCGPFDADKNKRLTRAMKRKALADLDTEKHLIGGPSSFSEHLVTSILNNLQLTITNIHIRYEDAVSFPTPVSAGVCISSITAETTNSKWKASKPDRSDICFYLVKLEALFAYWNTDSKPTKWDLPSQYYMWRNAMANSLQNFSLNNENFEFLVKPMTTKVKMTINKSNTGNVTKISSDVIVQDCNIQMSKKQYDSIAAVGDSLSRMLISWNFLATRPKEKVSENTKDWWKYAYNALLEQRVRPYTWSRVKAARQCYKDYVESYKQIILNPNDTERKLDLQKFEDNLSVVNIVIARQQARLVVQARSLNEKNLWSMLPSPERTVLCEQIGFGIKSDENAINIEHKYQIRMGNITIALLSNAKEILIATLTQFICTVKPNFRDDTYSLSLKIEGLIVEGSNQDENLTPIVASEHLSNSPAYFLKAEFEKLAPDQHCTHKLIASMDSLECNYHKQSIEDINAFLHNNFLHMESISDYCKSCPGAIYNFLEQKISERWDLSLNIKIPYLVFPEDGLSTSSDNILVVDLGRYTITTEICEQPDIADEATQMELEEQLFSKLHITCNDMQVLLCDRTDNWKDTRKEKDTVLHIIPKTTFSGLYAKCARVVSSIPQYKFNINFQSLKLNISERKIDLLLKFLNIRLDENENFKLIKSVQTIDDDTIAGYFPTDYLLTVQNSVAVSSLFMKNKKSRTVTEKIKLAREKSKQENTTKGNMNEAYARYVDLPGLEDNISPNNSITTLFRLVINEFTLIFSRSSDSTDRQYLMLRLGQLMSDVAFMTYGPAYQVTLNSILLTDKLHTTPSGQYLDLVYSPVPSTVDVVTVLYRKVSARCPDFWSHFHGVETSLVADFGTAYLLLHQEAIHTLIKYTKYIKNKIMKQIPTFLLRNIKKLISNLQTLLHKGTETPVPPGSVKFSHSARLSDLNVKICDSDFDIVNVQLSGLEMDFLFRANERFVFRSFLSNISIEHLSDVTLYSKVLSTNEDKVFEVKYVRQASHIKHNNDISPSKDDTLADGSFKLHLGQIHITFLYKLLVQLQRFTINSEALPYVKEIWSVVHRSVTTATNTLKNSSKIHLAINVCGPVLLFPQKSSSPNVLIIDTGEFLVENFFKEYPHTDTVENILLKWNNISVSRGVMTFTSTLEMQESLVEPVNLNMDIKRYTNVKTFQKSWDIDGILDTIQITLGQKDASTVFSIYRDNIGEGKIIDLFPDTVKSPTDCQVVDETVKTLEAFFCEPKQKNIVAKFQVEGIKLMLFFDSGELLSSPIRDLNHGLCKFEISEINLNFVIYTDRSLDGKLSVDTVLIEEIGPDANVYDKGILQSPMDDSKNNNCNITVNKPPVIDVTFHQNKTGDKSVDVIVGKLSLSLSIPFCEKLALFILECLPKETLDVGIINHGYEGDCHQILQHSRTDMKSLTVSLRVNKPEFLFLIETTSNKKRYFITKTEILSDYSRHSNCLNFVVSLSGLHTLFYDFTTYSFTPYPVIKQCDVEFSQCYLDGKSDKITISVSTINVQLCSAVVHSISDILNDIIEHFKIPDGEVRCPESRKGSKAINVEDLWEPRKLSDFALRNEPGLLDTKIKQTPTIHELLIVPKFDIIVICELEEIQVMIVSASLEVTIHNWSSLLNCTCEFTIQANYYNEGLQTWEPILDPVVMEEKEYRPWDCLVKIFQDKSMLMLSTSENKFKKEAEKGKKSGQSAATTDDEDSGEGMVYLEPKHSMQHRTNRRVKTSLSTFLDDYDSENEDGAMEKLAAAIYDLFTGDWNENEDAEDSPSVHSSEGEDESDENVKTKPPVVPDPQLDYKKATYVLIDAKESLNITVTPTFLKMFNELLTMYTNKTLSIITDRRSINVTNDIGPQTRVDLYEKKTSDNVEDNKIICTRTFENVDTPPASPSKMNYQDYGEDMNEDKDSVVNDTNVIQMIYDIEAITHLNFPPITTSQLFDKINRHYMKIYVPNFLPLQTNCSQRNWKKLVKLHLANSKSTHMYHLACRHTIGKFGRSITVGSPLQIKNETCFALSVLYQPSVLQQLNLEPVGDVMNPFETTMRIAVLEAHDQYSVPLYIAYHCKLFIQPAYAEGHYASDTGIWWQDLATEMDVAYNLCCKPKGDSNLEVFSLRVVLERNLEIKNALSNSIPNYVIRLLPPLILYNYLPYTIDVENLGLKQFIKVEPGEKNSVYSLEMSKDQKLSVQVKFQHEIWTGTLNLTTHLDEKVIVLATESKDTVKNLAINVKCDTEGSCNLFFYTPYWIINKTGLPLQIRASVTNTVYDSANEDILLFTYKRHGKQTLHVRVYESNWSNEFGLECAGTTGLVVCKDVERKKKYMFFLTIRLSKMCPRLTKIVRLLPSFLVTNNTEKNLRFMEHNEKSDLWVDLPPNNTIIFWPETSSMQMYVKYRGSRTISQAFYIAMQHRTVLRMDKGTAVTVHVTGGTTGPFRISFNEYKYGDSPIFIRNYCADIFLKIQQKSQSQVTLLNPYHGLLYTWDDPTKPNQLVWNVYNNKGTGFLVDIFKDGFGEEEIRFHSVTPTTSVNVSSSEDDSDSSDSVKTSLNKKVRKDKIVMFWVCYRDESQRTLVFTQESRVYNQILKSVFYEHCNVECLVSLAGMNISIFTSDDAKREHLCASLVDSPAMWEVNIGHKWKTLTLELASWIEDKYKLHYKKCQLKDYIHIDFEKMFMLKPFFAELRRTYYPAVYFQMRKSAHLQDLNLKIHSLQIDNKYSNNIVLYTELYRNTKSANYFLDANLCRSSSNDCDVYKDIKLNIGNIHLNIENDLFLKLNELLSYNKSTEEAAAAFRSDMTSIHTSVTAPPKKSTSKKTITEHLSVSGFGIQVYVSNKRHRSVASSGLPFCKILDYLLPINISPYMPMEGVHHKISAMEQMNIYDSTINLGRNVLEQIIMQFLQQYYSLVLGLQVLVNTFVSQAPPLNGVVQSDSEKMASVVFYGSRCLLGHINMSPAALEQCIADIFVNQSMENIQRIRRHGSYHKSEIVPKSITVSCRNFTVGVPNILNQLIVKSQNAVVYADAEMFFRTTGKALLSLLTRHPDEKSDCVEVAKEALRRASLLGEPIRIHQRLTRYSNKYLGVKPFSIYDSVGHYLLETIANSRFVNDTYWAYAPPDKAGKSLIIISLEHVTRVTKCRLWGPWEIDWSIGLDDISMPKISGSDLVIQMREVEEETSREVRISGDKEVLTWLSEKIEQAIILSMEDKSWAITDSQ